jgi:AcrR family transcriptional regulator
VTGEVEEGTKERRRLAPVERRGHLLDVAASLVVERGIDAVTMERVAQHAGVSRGLGYAYFENSDDLLSALYLREISDFDERLAAAAAGAETLEDHMRATITVYFDVLAEKGVLLTRLAESAPATPGLAERRMVRDRAVEQFYGEMVGREMGIPPKRARAIASVMIKALPHMAELWGRGVVRRTEAIELFIVMAKGAATAAADHPFEARTSRGGRRRT